LFFCCRLADALTRIVPSLASIVTGTSSYKLIVQPSSLSSTVRSFVIVIVMARADYVIAQRRFDSELSSEALRILDGLSDDRSPPFAIFVTSGYVFFFFFFFLSIDECTINVDAICDRQQFQERRRASLGVDADAVVDDARTDLCALAGANLI
jgi:hypothetical protein